MVAIKMDTKIRLDVYTITFSGGPDSDKPYNERTIQWYKTYNANYDKAAD